MSMSEMSRSTYRAHRQSVRANGVAYTLARIECPLEREDMRFLCAQAGDELYWRAWFSAHPCGSSKVSIIKLATPFFKG